MVESIEQGLMEPLYTIIPTNPIVGRPEPERQLKPYDSYSVLEKARYDVDDVAQSYLIMSLTNDVFRKLDGYKNSSKKWYS